MTKPQSGPGAAEDRFDAEDDFSLNTADPWRAPDALARPAGDDPFAPLAGGKPDADPFEDVELPSYAASEPAAVPKRAPLEAFLRRPAAPASPAPDADPFEADLDDADLAEPAVTGERFEATPSESFAAEPFAAEPFAAEPFAAESFEEASFEVEPFETEVFAPEPFESVSFDAASLEAPLADQASPASSVELESEPPPPPPAEVVEPLSLHAFGHGHPGELSVPRIGIHIFCERPDTTLTAEQSAQDRRMARANTMVRPGGLSAAVEYYRNQPTPPLVIVESTATGEPLVNELDRLAEVCDTGTKVVVIGAHNDIALYRELMRRGVSEYLVAPLHTIQLIQAITTLYADPAAPFVGRQIAFCGARGGVGSSTIAHNLAHLLSEQMQSSTVIVDFDLAFGTAGLDFNQDPLQGVVDALSQPDRLDPVLLERMMARCGERLSLFAAPATLDHDYDIAPEAFEEVASKVRTTAPFVVLDLPHLWSNWMRRVLLGADEVVITAVPDLSSLRNAKNIIDLLRQARPNDAPPRLVLNQVGVPNRPEIPAKDFGAALGLETMIVVPFDAKLFGQASNNGQMIEEVNARSKAAEGLHALAQQIARREPPPAPKKSALSGLFKRK